MAQVVLVTQDPDVLIVLDEFLSWEGHAVMSALDEQHALPVLELGRSPAVVIIHAPRVADDGFGLLRRALSDTSGRLARHSYILLTGDVSAMTPARRAQLARIRARVLDLPFDLTEVAAAVEGAKRELYAGAVRIPTVRVAPRDLP